MKLFVTAGSPYARKTRVVLAEKRIDCEIVMLASLADPDSPLPAYNPLGKVPTLVLDDGSGLYDSPVIAEYLDSKTPVAHLIPQAHRIEVKRWEALADGVCDATVAIVMEGRRAPEKQDNSIVERQRPKVERGLRNMSQDLGDSKWCLGEAFTLADIAVGCALGYINLRMPELKWEEQYPNLARLHNQLLARPSFKDTVPPG
ncbi:glutathione S-transferase [Novimethylophilus kurashikiensis]|uniref:Glutathione S-transferase n=1 Tax=Novimethylophilus kurashikiensis TaxID=1825523 RepID=A0A2R5FI86_9PROT|nr:glutathione S-transferase N-terminal domain-containing protein [Novimethylophilus kurashikiensis]GBG15654.1 glutathione S-transferase [Novimethylophilus kurashikiensis]